MARKSIDEIRSHVRLGSYDMTVHAVEELAEDGLDILDFEQSVLYGQLSKIEKDDPRGTKYVVEGPAIDETILVGSVGRFINDRYLVITVYAITDSDQNNYV